MNNATPLSALMVDGVASVDPTSNIPGLMGTRMADAGGTLSALADKSHSGYRVVSAVNTQNQIVLDLRNLSQTLSILMAASGATATLTVEVSTDQTNWIQVDSIAAAQFIAKVYGAATAGAAAAAAAAGPLAPLSFRYVRITAPAVAAQTTTLTVGAK